MNIEEANDNLIMLKYFLQEEGDENWEKYCEAIETLLTAYEKEKEKNRSLEQEKEYLNCIIESDNDNYINKDKIKAKVIEIKNRPVKDEFITATQGKLNTIIDIESLLYEEE